jgi:hypothetical protein
MDDPLEIRVRCSSAKCNIGGIAHVNCICSTMLAGGNSCPLCRGAFKFEDNMELFRRFIDAALAERSEARARTFSAELPPEYRDVIQGDILVSVIDVDAGSSDDDMNDHDSSSEYDPALDSDPEES